MRARPRYNVRGMKILIVSFLFTLALPVLANETEISAPELGVEREDSTSALESEGSGIIPAGGLTVSTQPITPITALPERNPRAQAMEALTLAKDLHKKGKYEAASDVALQAYDDLMGMYLPRRNKTKRKELRYDRRQAATVYIDASIAYIQEYVKKRGGTTEARKEGRLRLGDLRDVALNYPELMKKVNQSIASLTDPA